MFFSISLSVDTLANHQMSAFKFTISRLSLIKPVVGRSLPNLLARTATATTQIKNIRCFSSTVDHLSKDQVQERVFNVLKAFDKVATTAPSFKPAASFTSDLGLDSLDVVEVLMAVEEEFGIEIPDEVADNFKTPQEVIEYVHDKLNHH